ncbi:MAG: hypothetical protein ACOC1K_04040 [Nanoarchaeota archaeon]
MSDNINKIDNLLNEFEEQRSQLKGMIIEIEEIKNKVDKLIPEPNENEKDYRNFSKGSRYISLFEERVKSITEFFRIILDMRKEISKTLKDEIDLRRKAEDSNDDLSKLLDISDLADKVEKFQKQKDKVKKKIDK